MRRFINVFSLVLGGLLFLVSSSPLFAEKRGGEFTGKDGAPMVLVPAGEFLYGDNNKPLSLPAFYMDKYEVTVKLYAKLSAGRTQLQRHSTRFPGSCRY